MLDDTNDRGWTRPPTREEIINVFHKAYEIGLNAAREGSCADYIPELAKADPGAFGIYALNGEGKKPGLWRCGNPFFHPVHLQGDYSGSQPEIQRLQGYFH